MAVPHVSANFGDLLDPRFEKIFFENYDQVPDMIPTLFGMPQHNGRADMRWSEIGAFGDWSEFTGTVSYDSVNQGYDTLMTFREFVNGFQVERKLYDDDQYNVMDMRPAALGRAAARTRQSHAAQIFSNAFSVDTYFYNRSEGVALCSSAHTTTAPGVSTSSGFSNRVTTAFSAVALSAGRIQMQKFKDDRGNKFNSMPDEIIHPIDLTDKVEEVLKSTGKTDSAENNINVHKGKYTSRPWIYLEDTNNWFLADGGMRKENLQWVDRVPIEYKQAEDIDTLVAKWRGYGRWANVVIGWRWILGAQVS